MSVVTDPFVHSSPHFLALPEWTDFRKKRGLDPLGMQASSIATYQRLVPGISNVTQRMRYYGLYAWLSRYYALHIRDTDPKTWQRFVRRGEALYALIAAHRGEELGVNGIDWAAGVMVGGKQKIDFAQASEPGIENGYLKNAWGAYGAAYAGQLHEIGILATAQNHQIPVPSDPVGEDLATAFAQAIGSAGDHFFRIHHAGRVTRSELDQLISLSPSEIRDRSSECTFYCNLLFGRLFPDRPNDLQRRRTLLLLLHIANHFGNPPSVHDIRWTLYEQPEGTGQSLDLTSPELQAHRMRWRIYQADDLVHIAYEALLKYLLDLLERYSSGVALNSLITEAVEEIRRATNPWPMTWEQHRNRIESDFRSGEIELTRSLMKEARLDGVCTAAGAWQALTLLAVIQNRTRSFRQQIQNELGGHPSSSTSRSLHTELEFLDSVSADNFDRVVCKLFEHRILRQHLWVAMRKLRYQKDYTFLVESDDGRIRLRAKDGPVFTNPRLDRSITFLRDIYLVDEHGLTNNGKRILAES